MAPMIPANVEYFTTEGEKQSYRIQLIETIKSDKRLVSKDSVYMGNPKISINCGVIFPNINKFEYTQTQLDRVISTEKVLFWDDLHPASPICCDATGACFTQAIDKMFPPKFSVGLTGADTDHRRD